MQISDQSPRELYRQQRQINGMIPFLGHWELQAGNRFLTASRMMLAKGIILLSQDKLKAKAISPQRRHLIALLQFYGSFRPAPLPSENSA